MKLCGIHLRAIWQWISELRSLKFILSKLLPYLPGVNELWYRMSADRCFLLQRTPGILWLLPFYNKKPNADSNVNHKNYFFSFLNIEMSHLIEILPHGQLRAHLYHMVHKCHACWWPGDTRNLDITRHDTDLVFPEYSSLRSRRVKHRQKITLIAACISNHMPGEVCDEIIYPFPNFSWCTTEVWKLLSYFILQFTIDVITYSCRDKS